jgi:outer membrane protein OmpA-like peptidoglycan-associated protein
MKSYIKIVVFVTMALFVTNSYSQKDTLKGNFDTSTTVKYNKWSIYAYGGLSQFYGDIVPRYSFSPLFKHQGIVSLNGFVGVSRQLTRLFSFDGRFQIANLASERLYTIAYTNSGTPEGDSLYFKGDLFNISLASTFSFSNWFWPNVKNRHWNAYFILGTGFTFYRSASYYMNKNKENQIYDYYGFKKVNNYDLEKDNRQIVPSATIGIGLKYRLTKRLDLGIEFTETSVYNDRLDAYVRVLSERDKFGHLDIGLSYHFEKYKKTLVWDFNDSYPEPINIDSIITNRICDCPIVKTTATTVDSISKAYTAMSLKTDSVMAVMKRDKEMDSDNDKVPDYRDFEPNSVPGALVDAKGVTIKEPEIVNPIIKPTKTGKPNIANDSLIAIINKLNSTVDALVRERNLEKGPDTDNDKIPDYRDDELNSAPGAIVDTKGVTVKSPVVPIINNTTPIVNNNDSLLAVIGKLKSTVDTLLNDRNLGRGQSPESNMPMMVMIKGTILDENKTPVEAQVDVIEKKSKAPVASFGTNGVNGNYAISLPAGKEYSISVKAKGYTFYSETLSVPDTANAKQINKGISMIKLDPGKRIVLRNIFYDFDKATLRPESKTELMNLLELMNSNPNLKIQIGSHTDNIGSAVYNKKLSLERAKSVVDFLVQRGISKDRLVSAGYGFDQPMTSNDTDAGRQLNRRTEFMIISN